MNINIQIADETYKALVAEGKRIKGSIGLTSTTTGNFSAYVMNKREQRTYQHIRLPHGRASVTEENVRLTLKISLDESGVSPTAAIIDEGAQAATFVDAVCGSQPAGFPRKNFLYN